MPLARRDEDALTCREALSPDQGPRGGRSLAAASSASRASTLCARRPSSSSSAPSAAPDPGGAKTGGPSDVGGDARHGGGVRSRTLDPRNPGGWRASRRIHNPQAMAAWSARERTRSLSHHKHACVNPVSPSPTSFGSSPLSTGGLRRRGEGSPSASALTPTVVRRRRPSGELDKADLDRGRHDRRSRGVRRRAAARGGGTPSRESSESRCVSGPQFSSPRAFAAPPSPARIETARESCSARRAQLVAEVLRELGSQEHESTVQLVRAQADALSEAELAGFLARAAWRTAPESWAETDAWKRAEWLLRNLVRWRESAEEGS
jgi:hypothetical protein